MAGGGGQGWCRHSGGWGRGGVAGYPVVGTRGIGPQPFTSSSGGGVCRAFGTEVRLDLDYEEDVACDADVNIVMNDDMHFIEIQGTAEQAPFARTEVIQLLDIAQGGIQHLFTLQKRCLQEQKGLQF